MKIGVSNNDNVTDAVEVYNGNERVWTGQEGNFTQEIEFLVQAGDTFAVRDTGGAAIVDIYWITVTRNSGWIFGQIGGTCVDHTRLNADNYTYDGMLFIRNITDDASDYFYFGCEEDYMELLCLSACEAIMEVTVDESYVTSTVEIHMRSLTYGSRVLKDGEVIFASSSGGVIDVQDHNVPGGTVYRIIEQFVDNLYVYHVNIKPGA